MDSVMPYHVYLWIHDFAHSVLVGSHNTHIFLLSLFSWKRIVLMFGEQWSEDGG